MLEENLSDPTRRTPSESRPKSIGAKIRARRLSGILFPTGLPKRLNDGNGPHYAAMLNFLNRFVDTPHERAMWDVYFDLSRTNATDAATIAHEVKGKGLTAQEYIAREVLVELERKAKQLGIVTTSPISDGPHGGNKLYKDGKSVDVPPIVWNLLNYLWKRKDRSAHIDDVLRDVWNDGGSDHAIDAAKRRANQALLDLNFGCEIRLKNRFLTIE